MTARARLSLLPRLVPGLLPGLALALLALSFGAVLIGPLSLSPGEVLRALTGQGEPQAQTVIWAIRLPRIGAALLLGAALAAAGASYQALFRNPLVSPDILGVSAGAGLGAVAGIFLSLPVAAIQATAFVGGMAAVGVVTLIATLVRNTDRTLTLVLIGVVIGALAGAATSLLKVLADPYDQLPAITFWLLGSLASITAGDILPALPAVALGLVPLVLLRWRINVLTLGDDEARALGIEAGRTRFLVIVAATLITASVTALAGAGAVPAWPQWLRQDHAVSHAAGTAGTAGRRDPPWRPPAWRAAPRQDRPRAGLCAPGPCAALSL